MGIRLEAVMLYFTNQIGRRGLMKKFLTAALCVILTATMVNLSTFNNSFDDTTMILCEAFEPLEEYPDPTKGKG